MSNKLFVNDKNNFKCRFQLLIVNDLLSTVFTLNMLYQLNILIITFEQKSILLYLDCLKTGERLANSVDADQKSSSVA